MVVENVVFHSVFEFRWHSMVVEDLVEHMDESLANQCGKAIVQEFLYYSIDSTAQYLQCQSQEEELSFHRQRTVYLPKS